MNNYYFWDTHAHVYDKYYPNIDDVIKCALDNNIKYILNSGADHVSNQETLEISKNYDMIYATLGIHPESASNYKSSDIDYIENNLNNPKVLAVGEIGLDYHYEGYNKSDQIVLFEKQLDLAVKYNLPVIIHSRDATEDTMNILKKYNLKGVIHSFSGSLETALEYVKMGYLLGINGVITFKNCKLKEILSQIPIENIVIETDAPYLTPVPFRGKQNQPAYTIHTAEFVASIYEVSIDKLATITNDNIKRIFSKL